MTKVIVYTREQCPYCPQLKKYLTLKGITYEEKDGSIDNQEYVRLSQIHGASVPLLITPKGAMTGFDIASINKLI